MQLLFCCQSSSATVLRVVIHLAMSQTPPEHMCRRYIIGPQHTCLLLQVVAPSQEGQADDSPAEGTLRKSASKRARRKAKKAAELAREIKTVMPTATASGVTHPEAADASPARTASPEAQTPVAQVHSVDLFICTCPHVHMSSHSLITLSCMLSGLLQSNSLPCPG